MSVARLHFIVVVFLALFPINFMAANAILKPQQMFYPTAFTATSWSGNSTSSGLRLYVSTKEGHIQELSSNPSQPASGWFKETLLQNASFTLNKDTQLASTTLNGTTRLYFYDNTSNLREWVYDGEWGVGSLVRPVKGFGRPLTALSWMNGTIPNVSVFYVDAAGGLFEATKSGDGEWGINPVGSARGSLSVWAHAWLNGGTLQKRLYYQDADANNLIRECTWNIKHLEENTWSESETNDFNSAPSIGMSFSGSVLNSGKEFLIVNPAKTNDISVYTPGKACRPQLWNGCATKLPGQTRPGFPIIATHFMMDNTEMVYVFYLSLDGSLQQVTYSGKWSKFSSVVAVFMCKNPNCLVS